MKCPVCGEIVDGAAIPCYKWDEKRQKIVKTCEHILRNKDGGENEVPKV